MKSVNGAFEDTSCHCRVTDEERKCDETCAGSTTHSSNVEIQGKESKPEAKPSADSTEEAGTTPSKKNNEECSAIPLLSDATTEAFLREKNSPGMIGAKLIPAGAQVNKTGFPLVTSRNDPSQKPHSYQKKW